MKNLLFELLSLTAVLLQVTGCSQLTIESKVDFIAFNVEDSTTLNLA